MDIPELSVNNNLFLTAWKTKDGLGIGSLLLSTQMAHFH